MNLAHASRRCAAALFGAAVGGLLAAILDARALRLATAEPPGALASFLAAAGSIAPLATVLGLAVAVAGLVLHPERAPSWRGLRAWFEAGTASDRARRATTVAAGVIASTLWCLSVIRLALRALSNDDVARVSGAGVALGALMLAVALGVVVLLAAELASRRAAELPALPLVGGAVAVAAAVLVWGTVSGTTGGTGGTLQVLGVLRRDELDLRAPGALVVIALAAYLAPSVAARVPAPIALALAVAPLGLTLHAARGGLAERRLAVAVERSAPLAKLLLPRLRRFGDADRDGVSRLFGGGDCDDRHAGVRPGADDVPGNGVDEDCSGSDAVEVRFDAPPTAAKSAPATLALPKEPALIFITVDTLRWDLGYAGNPRPVSKQIDALAARSVVYERAYSLASYTGKSVGPLLAGKYGSETHRGWSHFNVYGKDDTLIQERLQRAGVRTLSVQCHWYFKENTGLGRGFDVLDLSAAPKQLQMEGDRGVLAAPLTDAAIAVLSKPENSSGRFFAWIHYLDPHAEYVKNPDFDFGSDARALYDSEVANTDRHIGRLLDFIAKSGFADRAVIVLTSDHGEAFGEHGMLRHGFEVWEELVRVPLILHVPGVAPRRIAARRGAVDLAPTFLEVFGAPPPSGEGSDFMSGSSLFADLAPGQAPRDKIVFVDMAAGPNNAERQAFIEGDLKVIATGGKPLGVYDLATDPGEKRDLLDDTERAAAAVERFKAFRRKLRVVTVRPAP